MAMAVPVSEAEYIQCVLVFLRIPSSVDAFFPMNSSPLQFPVRIYGCSPLPLAENSI